MNKNQKGFTLIEGLLVLIAVTIVGFVGFYVYNANKKSDQSNANQSKSADAAKEKVGSTSKEEKNKNLVVKELGIQFALTDALKDVTYEVESENTVQFKDAQFTKLVEACNDKTADVVPYFGVLSSYEGVYDEANMGPNVYQEFIKQLPGSYLMYGAPDGGFCFGEKATEAQRTAVNDRFKAISEPLKEVIRNATQPQ